MAALRHQRIFFQIVLGPSLNELFSIFFGEAADNHNGNLGRGGIALEALEYFKASHPWQEQVQKNQVEWFPRGGEQSGFAILRANHLIARSLQGALVFVAHSETVINQEYFHRKHRPCLVYRRPVTGALETLLAVRLHYGVQCTKDKRASACFENFSWVGLTFSAGSLFSAGRLGSLLEHRKLNLLFDRIDAVDEHAHAIPQTVGFSRALANNLARRFVVRVAFIAIIGA